MKRPTGSPIYGWPAPPHLSTYHLLAAFLAGSALALTLATALLALLWGPPPGLPLVASATRRIVSLACLALLGILMVRPAWRRVALSAMAVFGITSAAPLYSPLHFVTSLARVLRSGDLPEALGLLACLAAGATIAMVLAQSLMARLRPVASATRGSTRWGHGTALQGKAHGLLLGRLNGQMLRFDGSGHLLTVAATRSGKGVGSILPNLLNHPGSLVVTDPKGENFFVTARYRRKVLKQEVVALDPFALTPSASRGFNPMDLIDLDGDNYVENAMTMADMIVSRRGHGHDSHWILEGRALLFAFILHAACIAEPARRNLLEVRRLLTLAPEPLKAVLKEMEDSKVEQVREGAGRILQKSDRERSAVFSTAQSYTHFLASPRMRTALSQTDFALEALTRDTLSLYLILPREHLATFAPWLRLMIACAYHICTHNLLKRARPKERILFLLDEFANLGYMSIMTEAISLGGGYGITLWLILQDMAQLKREYRGEWESFVANSDVIQAFAIQDPFTSEKVSRMLGQTTVWQRHVRRSGRREGRSLVRDYNEDSRPLLRPEELRRLHPDRQLLLVRPYQPLVADKIRYYQDPLLKGRFDPNPYFTG